MCTKKQTCILLYLLQILIHFSNGKEFSFEKVNSQISKSTYLLKGKTNFYRGQHRYRFEWSAYSKIILIFFFFSNIETFLNLKTYMRFFLVWKYLEKFSIFFDFEIFLKSSYFVKNLNFRYTFLNILILSSRYCSNNIHSTYPQDLQELEKCCCSHSSVS